MRIDGFSPQSYPVKRAPRKPAPRDDVAEDAELIEDTPVPSQRALRRNAGLPARQQDMIYPRARDRRTAAALASYLSTATLNDWDMDVLGLDLYI